MDKKLYYCDYWQKKSILEYSYCISDLIFQSEKNKSLAQIHGIILYKDSILTFSKEQLSAFEESIRCVIRKEYKDSVIKIWYYNEGDAKFDIEHVPSRFAITIQVSESINIENISLLTEIEKCVVNLISSSMD